MAQFKVKGILSYPHLFQARSVSPGDDPRFSVTVLIEDTDPQLANILALQEQEKSNGFPSGFPSKGKFFCKPSEDYPGYHQISGGAKEYAKPLVCDMSMQPVMDPSQVFAGAVAWVSFNSFSYDQAVNKGVSAGLNGVMVTGEEGTLGRIDGRPTAHSMFGDISESTAPAAAPSAPASASTPPAPTPPAPPSAPAPSLTMTAAATNTYEEYLNAGWTDEQMISAGVAIKPSFA